MYKLLHLNIIILSVLLLFFSCNIDSIELENDDWSPELVAPLINSTLTIGNLIPEQGNVLYDDDNFIRLAFRDDSLFKMEAQSFVSIPNSISFEEQFLLSDLDINDVSYGYSFLLGDLFIDYNDDPLIVALTSVLFDDYCDGIDVNCIDGVPSPFDVDIQASLFNNIDQDDLAGVDLSFVIDEFQSISFENGSDINVNTENGSLAVIYSELNTGRLPDYHRLDLSIKKKHKFSKYNILEWSLGITNCYDRSNIFYYDRIQSIRVDQLPIMPTLGLNWTF